MTPEQWLSLKVGDVIIDHAVSGARRTVLSVSRSSGKPTQRGNVRTCIQVENIKSPGSRTTIFSTCDSPNRSRFSLMPAPPPDPVPCPIANEGDDVTTTLDRIEALIAETCDGRWANLGLALAVAPLVPLLREWSRCRLESEEGYTGDDAEEFIRLHMQKWEAENVSCTALITALTRGTP